MVEYLVNVLRTGQAQSELFDSAFSCFVILEEEN